MVQYSGYNFRRINKKAFIIGSGIGGLSTALRLQHIGFDVEIFEKNPTVGGKTNILDEDGFKFDLSATIFMLPKPYIELFDFIGEDYSKYFTIKPLDINYKTFYNDGTDYEFSSYLPKLMSTLHNLYTEDEENFLSVLSDIHKKYTTVNKDFLNSPLISHKDNFNSKKILNLIKSTPFKTCYDYLKKNIKNEKLLNFFLFQCMYVGASPFEASSIYTIIPAMSLLQGLWHIEGGLYKYISTLKDIFLSRNGKIHTKTEVNKILFEDERAIGVELFNGKKIISDLIISNADYTYSIINLMKDAPNHKALTNSLDFSYSPSTFILYLGLNKKFDNLNVHNIFIGDDFKGNLHAPFDNKLSLNPPLYVYCPSRLDSTLVTSPTKETINIIVRVPNLLDNNINWDDKNFLKEYRNIVLDTLKSFNGFEDIDNFIEYESYLTPLTYNNIFNTYGGAAFGISHNTSQSLFFRPQCKLKPYKNLYFAGASIHPGNGVSMVLNSSKILSDVIAKDFNIFIK
ncbi:MAG: phytoene desaturase family protein [Clostridium sp.]